MKTYARIEAGSVVELVRTDREIGKLFHSSLRWQAVTDPEVAVGWIEREGALAPPPAPAPEPVLAPLPTLTELSARVAELEAKVARLPSP